MSMDFDCDALIIGAGPSGSAAAILLAQAGWRVLLVEQHAYPRRKVCGECVAAGNLALLDALGIGAAFRAAAGPELRQIGWMGRAATVCGDMPPCTDGPYPYGRAFGRERLDTLLLERARSLGVAVLQPAYARSLSGVLGSFECNVESASGEWRSIRAPVVVDAHGSWERGPRQGSATAPSARRPQRASDLFAFKATYRNTALPTGFLPVLALPGGYGGMVVADDGRTTLACCIRRDTLSAVRAQTPKVGAGGAVEAFLRGSCVGVRAALVDAQREGAWLSVGPLRPGIRLNTVHGPFRVGNAAGESHALIGEGLSMALQSSVLLAATLTRQPVADIRGARGMDLHRTYAAAWRRRFAPRLRLAALYAQIAMRPLLAEPTRALLAHRPALLCRAAQLAGKAATGAFTRLTETA
jgi:flavin-dependent dehydrogenase